MKQATQASTLEGYTPYSFEDYEVVENALLEYFKNSYKEATGENIDYLEDYDTAKCDAALAFVRACTKALDKVNVKKFLKQANQ